MTLLIIGVMIGYVANAVIGVLKFFSVEEDIRAYVIWGLGSFSRISGDQLFPFLSTMAVLLPLSFLLIKTLNLLLLGDSYARNLGLNIKRARLLVISCSGAFGGDCYGLLWTDCFSGTGCAASLPCFVPYFRPSDIDAFFFTGRGGNGVIV